MVTEKDMPYPNFQKSKSARKRLSLSEPYTKQSYFAKFELESTHRMPFM